MFCAWGGLCGYGHYVLVVHAGGFTTLYGHLSGFNVADGTQIVRNQDNKALNFQRTVTYQTLDEFARNSPFSIGTLGQPRAGMRNTYNQFFVQDDMQATRKLGINAGLRYDFWTGFNLDQSTNPIWQALSTQTKYHEKYLQDFQNGGGKKLKNDTNNFGPRIGFSYDLKADTKNIIRGGYGRYFDFPYTNATILFP